MLKLEEAFSIAHEASFCDSNWLNNSKLLIDFYPYTIVVSISNKILKLEVNHGIFRQSEAFQIDFRGGEEHVYVYDKYGRVENSNVEQYAKEILVNYKKQQLIQ